MTRKQQRLLGFTIVELLIVIVVVGILVAITVVAYTGVQRRANNTATIAAVNQTVKGITSYIALNGVYIGTGAYCIVPSTTCAEGGPAVAVYQSILNKIRTAATVPSFVAATSSSYNGIVYDYHSTRTFNGDLQPAVLTYSLDGEGQSCGVANTTNSGGWTMATGNSPMSANGATICIVSIQGPAS